MQRFEVGWYIKKKVTAELIRDTEEMKPVRTAVPHTRGKQKNAIFSSKDEEEGGGVLSSHRMKNIKDGVMHF